MQVHICVVGSSNADNKNYIRKLSYGNCYSDDNAEVPIVTFLTDVGFINFHIYEEGKCDSKIDGLIVIYDVTNMASFYHAVNIINRTQIPFVICPAKYSSINVQITDNFLQTSPIRTIMNKHVKIETGFSSHKTAPLFNLARQITGIDNLKDYDFEISDAMDF